MPAIEVESSAFEPGPLEAFLEVEGALLGDDPEWRALPRSDARAQLRPEAPFFARGGEHRLFVARRGGAAVGRVAAMRSPRLVEADEAGVIRPVGLVGLFECVDDVEVARALLEPALAWLRSGPNAARRVLGPMNFSTWYRYRFVTGGRERGPFLLEPWNPAHYPALFEACGFTPHRRYASLRVPLIRAKFLVAAHQRCVKEGVHFEPLDLDAPERTLPMLHALSTRIFAVKTAYSDVELDEFQALYSNVGALLQPGLSWVARRGPGGEPLGFLFAYPNLLQAASGPIRHTVLKTIACIDDGPAWLGLGLTHLHHEHAAARGYEQTIYALMEKWAELLPFISSSSRMAGHPGELWKEYALYAHDPG